MSESSDKSERQCLRALTDGRCSYPNCMCAVRSFAEQAADAQAEVANVWTDKQPSGDGKSQLADEIDKLRGQVVATSELWTLREVIQRKLREASEALRSPPKEPK